MDPVLSTGAETAGADRARATTLWIAGAGATAGGCETVGRALCACTGASFSGPGAGIDLIATMPTGAWMRVAVAPGLVRLSARVAVTCRTAKAAARATIRRPRPSSGSRNAPMRRADPEATVPDPARLPPAAVPTATRPPIVLQSSPNAEYTVSRPGLVRNPAPNRGFVGGSWLVGANLR